MWLRSINDSGKEFRYELSTHYTHRVMMESGRETIAFVLYKYWKNNNGEFELCHRNEIVYVPVDVLLSSFVLIDSEVDKTIISLNEFKLAAQAEELEKQLAPFCVNSVEESKNEMPDAQNLANGDKITNLD